MQNTSTRIDGYWGCNYKIKKRLILFFEKLREDGFDDWMKEAKELVHEVGIGPIFAKKKKRVVRKNKQFDEDVGEDADGSQSHEDNFRVTYFLHI